MSREKVLFVFCHPDDEVICGWPLLQDASIDKEVLICSSDALNPQRKWCSHRKQALAALCDHLHIPCRCLDFDSDFYRTPHRKPPRKRGLYRLLPKSKFPYFLQDVGRTIVNAVSESGSHAVFTHNPWGEYGHLDHVFVSRLIFDNIRKPVYVTDMRMEVDWLPLAESAPLNRAMLAPHHHSSRELDREFYEQCASWYKRDRVWTWSREPVQTVNLYRISPLSDGS